MKTLLIAMLSILAFESFAKTKTTIDLSLERTYVFHNKSSAAMRLDFTSDRITTSKIVNGGSPIVNVENSPLNYDTDLELTVLDDDQVYIFDVTNRVFSYADALITKNNEVSLIYRSELNALYGDKLSQEAFAILEPIVNKEGKDSQISYVYDLSGLRCQKVNKKTICKLVTNLIITIEKE